MAIGAIGHLDHGKGALTEAILKMAPPYTSRYFHSYLHDDPWPLFVRYEGEKAVFVPRDQYYFRDPAGPSACLWIVPGSACS